jgi:hypothetical protein
MKNILFSLLFILLFSISSPLKAANEDIIVTNPETTINYDLAFPGILPDHPLYVIKKIRNKILVSFIQNPTKKINYYLKETDKGILATAMLVDKNKYELAAQTALRAEHNYTLLIEEVKKLQDQPDQELIDRLHTASLKHQEVLQSLYIRVPQQTQEVLNTVDSFSVRNWQTIEEYLTRPTYFSL